MPGKILRESAMPRGPRLDAQGTLHHVIIRGIERGNIVRDDTDRKTFLDTHGNLSIHEHRLIYQEECGILTGNT